MPEPFEMIEKMNLPGLANLTHILAFCASDKPHVSGAYRMK